jgi:hypothetical protein
MPQKIMELISLAALKNEVQCVSDHDLFDPSPIMCNGNSIFIPVEHWNYLVEIGINGRVYGAPF